MVAVLVSGLVWGLAGSAGAGLVINEFLADPDGSDGGREFVELLNTGPELEYLEGVALQFANGAEGAVWATRWTGTPGLALGVGERFLIVDRNWLGEAVGQEEVFLGLQNGPDALRLSRDAEVLDMVGYGPLTDTAMMETNPADIRTGLSSARRPDGNDTGDNGSDFVLAEPTPGARNFLPFSLAVTQWELDPPSADRPGMSVRFSVEILNEGTETFPVGPVLLEVGGGRYPSLLDLMPTGSRRSLTWILEPSGRGLHGLEIRVPLPAGSDTLVLRVGSLQVGPGELVLNEVLAAPGHGQGEWLEIAAHRDGPVTLGGYRLRDEDGPWRTLPGVTVEAAGLVVLVQDSLALAEWHFLNTAHGAIPTCPVELALSRQHELPGWPSLNNSIPESRDFADRIYLANPAGDVIDHLTLRDEGVAGYSLERLAEFPHNPVASNWANSTAGAGSTPGCPNSVALDEVVSMAFTVRPRILDPSRGATTVHFLFTLVEPQQGWGLRVFDLWGGLVRDFGGDDLGPGPRDLPWDGLDEEGRPAGPGGYIALLETRDSSRRFMAREKFLLAIR